jgi:hypothetical protein
MAPMPLGQQPLPATDIQTIENWIAAGAKPEIAPPRRTQLLPSGSRNPVPRRE